MSSVSLIHKPSSGPQILCSQLSHAKWSQHEQYFGVRQWLRRADLGKGHLGHLRELAGQNKYHRSSGPHLDQSL